MNDIVRTPTGHLVRQKDLASLAYEEVDKLLQQNMEHFIERRVTDPWGMHAGFAKKAISILKEWNLTDNDISRIVTWYYEGKPTALGKASTLAYIRKEIAKIVQVDEFSPTIEGNK